MADGDAPLAKRTPLTMILKLVATVVILRSSYIRWTLKSSPAP
jgi:hypothetical protein